MTLLRFWTLQRQSHASEMIVIGLLFSLQVSGDVQMTKVISPCQHNCSELMTVVSKTVFNFQTERFLS